MKMRFRDELQVLAYMLRQTRSASRKYIPVATLCALIKALSPLVWIYFPRLLVDGFLAGDDTRRLIMLGCAAVVLSVVLRLIQSVLETKVSIYAKGIKTEVDVHIERKIMSLPYEMLEDPDVLNLKNKAVWVFNNYGGIGYLIDYLVSAVSLAMAAVAYAVILSGLSAALFAVVLCVGVINYILNLHIQKAGFEQWDAVNGLNRRFLYLNNTAADFSYAKDIRLFGASGMIMSQFKRLQADWYAVDKKAARATMVFGALSKIMRLGVFFGAILYLAWLTSTGAVNVASLLMYVLTIVNLNDAVSRLFTVITDARQMCRHGHALVQFMGLKDAARGTGGQPLRVDGDTGMEIEFCNVSFRYPSSDDDALKNVSFKLHQGEKVSLVGRNGAGKSTIIKLLCRFYVPTQGEILLNGVNIEAYDHEAYMKVISAVFQDFVTFEFPIRENITMSSDGDQGRLERAAAQSGLAGELVALPLGTETTLGKSFDPEGTILSGGQMQKLAIARAIYHKAPLLLLDEPSSALDPMAEEQIYMRLQDIAGDSCVIYISHRMSSCQFCDRVLVLQGGRLAEEGTHQALLAQNGHYAELFHAQAQFYEASHES